YYEYGNDHGYKVVVRLDNVVEAEDLIAIRITSKTSQLLIDEVEAAYCNRVPYNIVENDACYGSESQFAGAETFTEGGNTYYKTEFGNLHYYNYNAVNSTDTPTTLSTILTDGNKNVTEVGNASGDGYFRFMKRDGNSNDTKQPYLIFDLGDVSDNQRSRTYKIYGAGGTWGVVTPETDAARFSNIKIYVSNDQVNWTQVKTSLTSKITGTGNIGSTNFDLWEVTYKSEDFNYGRYVKFEFGDCHHLWMSEIEIIREYDANSDIDVRYYNRTGGNHQHDNACADCGFIEHQHTLQCGFNCPYETHTHEFCEMSCMELHDHTDSCYTCGKIYHVHESKEFVCNLTKQQILEEHHVHGFDCYAGEGCLYCTVSHSHDESCDALATCGKVAHIHKVDCIGGVASGCPLEEHTHDDVECYRTKECRATFLASGGHTAHNDSCFVCGHTPHEHDYRCGNSCFYIEKDVMYPQQEHLHSSENSYDCWTYDWFVVQYDIGEDGEVGVMLNDDGSYTLIEGNDDVLKMYRIVTTSSPSLDSNGFSNLPELEDNCLEIKLNELGQNQFYFYKSQTGALMDSL
ncbi:MAG: discoidin domain-containing protein, partial [Clostridia bacterium]|nr:discoidin domain-containing protein [Clostridia bacterium]